MQTKQIKAWAMASTLLAGLGAAAPALAQEEEAVETRDTVVVTGSRIARADFVSNSPITTVDAAQFELTGTINVENMMNTLPQTVPGFDRTSNNPGNGTATVDLRGLGSTRTLVLVDGARLVPSNTAGTVDLNNIPPALIERVEVVTGGASAVYGSDAIAGVVNFIMKRDFEGVDARAGYQFTQDGDSDVYSLGLTFGTNMDNGRGNAVLHLAWNQRQALMHGDREFSEVALLEDGAGGLFPGGSSLAAPGVLVSGNFIGTGASPNGLVIFNDDGTIRPFVASGEPNDFYNYAPTNFLQLPQDRFQSYASARYEVNRHVEVYGNAYFTLSRVDQQLADTPFLQVLQFTLDGNPFIAPSAQQSISDAVGDGVDTSGNGIDDTATVQIRRRQLETGPRQSLDSRFMFQFEAGVRGDLLGNWRYDASYVEGRLTNSAEQVGNNSRARLQQGLLLDLTDPTNPQCQDPSGGCVPVNIFGENKMSADAATFVSVRVNSAFERHQRVLAFNIMGDTSGAFELPGGPIGAAFGMEYQEQFADFRPSDALARGDILGFNASAPQGGSYDALGIYGEFYAPILSGHEFAEILAIEGAIRQTNYSTVGNTLTWKIGGEWAPIPDIRFRTSFNTAIRAPSVGELFAPQNEGFPSAQDPCSAAGGADPTDNTSFLFNTCMATGVAPGDFGSPALNAPAGQIRGIFGGNPNLAEEEAETFTIGAVITPQAIPNLSVSIDYFDIQMENRIAGFGGGVANVLNNCYTNTTLGGGGSAFCDIVNRRPDGTIENVLILSQNIAESALRGIDLAVAYSVDTDFGLFNLNYVGTYTQENSIVPFPGADTIECANAFGQVCGTPDPRYRHRATLGWSNFGNVQTNLVWRYIGSSSDDQNDPTAFAVTQIGSKNYFDGSVSWDLTDNYNLTFGINNILNESPPILGENAQQANTFPNMYDVFGRTFHIAARARF
jgi:iron complex outermembrane receptor protein